MNKKWISTLLSIVLIIALTIGIMPINAEAGDYGSFVSGSQVIDDLINKYGDNKHPRIIMTEEKFAKLRTYVKDGQVVNDGSVTAALLIELKGEADNYYSAGIPPYEVDSEGHILEYSKRIQRYVATLALVYNIFGDEKYAEHCYAVMESACKSSCQFGYWNPHHFLDTAEMCTGLAYGYDWLYDWMDEGQKKLIRDTIIKKGFNQVMNDYEGKVHQNNVATSSTDRSYVWYGSVEGDNWMFVCTGGMNLAALAIGDEEDARDISAKVLDYGYKKAYTAVRQGYDITDGTYVEGLGYWDYATYYLGLQSSALKSATGSDYGLTDYEGIRKSVDFVRYMSSNYPYSFSFGDDGDSRDTGWPVFLWLGEHFDLPGLSAIRLRKIEKDPEFRYLDVLWIDESKQDGTELISDTDWGFVGSKNASFRNTWDISGTVAALHAGKNDYMYHGHFDLGSFYIESEGVRFFTDLGNEKYKLDKRELSYRIKPEGHNTLVLNPSSGTDQLDGVICPITDYSAGSEAYAVTDLTAAYGGNDAKSVVRGLKMIKDKECVIIQDEISLNKAGEIYWFAHTKGDIDIASDGRSAIVTVTTKEGEIEIPHKLWVGLMSEGGRFTSMDAKPLSTSEDVPGATINKGYSKLAIHLTNTKDTTISVACIPLKNGETKPSWTPSVSSISSWSAEAVTTEATVKYCNISLSDTTSGGASGNIGLNVYAKLSSDVVSAAGASMVFTLNGKEIPVAVSGAGKVTVNGEQLYKFTCPVPAAYMTSNITAQVRMTSNGKQVTVGDKYTYSVRSYADAVIKNSTKYGADNVAMVKAMLNYGAYAQKYFDINTSNLANKNIYDSTNDPVLKFSQNLSSKQLSGVATDGDLEFYGASLVCKGETSLKLYFGSKSGATISSGRYAVKAVSGGKSRTCSGTISNNMYVVTLTGIAAAELDNTYQFTITDSKNSSNNFIFNYSPVNYMANAQKSSDTNLVNLTRAMYLYNQAANKCFTAQ